MKRIMWAAMMTLALSPIPAVAQDASATVKEVRAATAAMDQALANTVAEKIRGYVRYTIFDDVTIGVDGGMVTLSGRVTQPYKVKDIGRIASRIEGVREVKNDLEVLPVSIHDDRLRTAIARQIYRDPVFDSYAIQVNPPIHIIVERGNVTLTGAVNSALERQKAEMIARSTFGVFNVENKLRIDS
jgi:osmotically-inducible protein OsmY